MKYIIKKVNSVDGTAVCRLYCRFIADGFLWYLQFGPLVEMGPVVEGAVGRT